LEADKLGTILAAKVGYDAKGLRRSIELLAAKQQEDLFLARFNKTHPPSADRLKVIDQALAANHLSAEGARLAERYSKNLPKAKS
jgi:predicted Zn-dependent protease